MTPRKPSLSLFITVVAALIAVSAALWQLDGRASAAPSIQQAPTATATITPDPTPSATPDVTPTNTPDNDDDDRPTRTRTATRTATPEPPDPTGTSAPAPTATRPGGGAGGDISPPDTGPGSPSDTNGFAWYATWIAAAVAVAGATTVLAGARARK